MRIVSADFEGMIGFYLGMGLDRVTIDFSRQQTRLVLILGANRRGKSTLLQHLHPFAAPTSTGEGRRSFLNPAYTGQHRKRIVFVDTPTSTTYVVEHLYSVDRPTRSFFTRNGEELNPGGGSTTFENLLESELGLTREYLKLGRIGEGVKDLVEMTSSNRKHFMNRILHDVDVWLQYHRNVMEHWRISKNRTTTLGEMLGRLEDAETLATQRAEYESQLDAFRRMRDDIVEVVGGLKARIDALAVIPDTDVDLRVVSTYSRYRDAYNEAQLTLTSLRDRLETDRGIIGDRTRNSVVQERSRLQTMRSSLLERCSSLHRESIEYSNQRQQAVSELERLSTRPISVEDVERQRMIILEQIYSSHSEITHYYRALTYRDPLTRVEITLRNVSEFLSQLHLFFVEARASTGSALDTYPRVSDAELRRENDTANRICHQLDTEIALLASRVTPDNLASHRPGACVIDSCRYFVNALENDRNNTRLRELRSSVTAWRDRAALLATTTASRNCARYFDDVVRGGLQRYRVSHLQLQRLGLDILVRTEIDLYTRFAWALSVPYQDVVRRIQLHDALVTNAAQYRAQCERYTEIEATLAILRDSSVSQERAVAQQRHALQRAVTRLAEIDGALVSARTAIEDTSRLEPVLETTLATFDRVAETEQAIKEYEKRSEKAHAILERASSYLSEYTALNERVNAESLRVREITDRMRATQSSLTAVVNKIDARETYTRELEQVSGDFTRLERAKRVLDPVKGIPMHHANVILSRVERPINDLLAVGCADMDRQLALKFHVTDTDFAILMASSNEGSLDLNSLPDISDGSSSERSIGRLGLSMGMMDRVLQSRYNIMAIDEIDGVFDVAYRRNFIAMLQHQLNVLNCEQAFIITHNREFDSIPVDVVLLPGHGVETFDNKNVLWRYD